MGDMESKKQQKRNALLDSAYELFTTIGYKHTTISRIVRLAGVGKGTFYLYFKDKEDIRSALIIRQSRVILNEAVNALKREPDADEKSFADKIVYITDYIVDYMSHDIAQLQFVSKYLSRGLFPADADEHSKTHEEAMIFRDYIERGLELDGIKLDNVRTVIFTIIELVSSTCYNVILNGEPVTLGEYKPYLYRCVRLLVNDAIENGA
jgi:AcrR family transcriptional regulator